MLAEVVSRKRKRSPCSFYPSKDHGIFNRNTRSYPSSYRFFERIFQVASTGFCLSRALVALRWYGNGFFGQYLSNAIRNARPALAHHLVSQLLKWVIGIEPVMLQEQVSSVGLWNQRPGDCRVQPILLSAVNPGDA